MNETYDGTIFKPDLDMLFEETCIKHYGRKGMKWGQNIFGKLLTGVRGVGGRARTAVRNMQARGAMKNIYRRLDNPGKYNNRAIRKQAIVGRLLTAKRPNLLNRTVKGDIMRGSADHFMGMGTGYKNASKMAKVGSTFLGTVRNQKVKKIASYNALSSQAKRGFKKFKDTYLTKHKKVKLGQLSKSSGSALSSLSTGVTKKSTPLSAISKAKSTFNTKKSVKDYNRAWKKANKILDRKRADIEIPKNFSDLLYTSINPVKQMKNSRKIKKLPSVEDYTQELLKKNARRLAGW